MNAPFYKFGYFNSDVSLIIAFLIGIGFGFALERGGFGSARILAAQFYLSNMRVLKVMFSAIITAMLGVYFFGIFGLLDLKLIYMTETYILPQAIGGLILGIGFVIGGYCPGTSVVSFATGAIDGLVYIIGALFGIFIYGEVYPFISNFANSTNMGIITLPEILHLPYGFIVFLVVLMAIGAFALSEWSEKKFGFRNPENDL